MHNERYSFTKKLILSVLIIGTLFTKSFAWVDVLHNEYGFQFDSNIVFNSPRPLISKEISSNNSKFWGLSLILSNNGFGVGGFYEQFIARTSSIFANLYISGARNTDEFEYYDPWTGEIFIPGKINRIYIFPLTIGLNQYLFTELFNTNFTPYLNIGIGPTFILTTPYEKEFFSSFGSSNLYVRLGIFVGTGVNIPVTDQSYIGISARQYWIPFGGKGLESIKDKPISDFGGFFLGLNFGIKI